MNLELKDKAILITGGASGIGAACAQLFVEEGARVAIVDRDRERGDALVTRLGGGDTIIFVNADLGGEAACCQAVERVTGAFRGLDVLVITPGSTITSRSISRPANFFTRLNGTFCTSSR